MSGSEAHRTQARELWERGKRLQRKGKLGHAIVLYRRSIALYPTAEAYTNLAWAYSVLELYHDAIELCKKAIELDPAYGNPYNDIGAYLMELEQWQEAIPWLEEATAAPRYETPQYAYLNLGYAYEALGDFDRALVHFNQALTAAPLYLPAAKARDALVAKFN